MPKRWATCSRSSSVVTGVILSTIEFGNDTLAATQSPRSGSRRRAYAVKTSEATWPFPWMLSQDMIVKGSMSRARRRDSASVTRPKTVPGTAPGARSACTAALSVSNFPVTGWKLYPPSVTVRDTIRVARSAICSITVRIVRGVSIGHDGSDHFWGPTSLRILLHERVETVLGHQGIADLEIKGHHPDAADS